VLTLGLDTEIDDDTLVVVYLLLLVGVDTLLLTYGVLVDTGVEVLTMLDVDGV